VGGSLVGFNGPHCATSMSFGGRPPHLKKQMRPPRVMITDLIRLQSKTASALR
jgi:hypothetical protein